MNFVYFGKGLRGAYCLEKLLENNYFPSLVISQNDNLKLIEPMCSKYDIPFMFSPTNINSEEMINLLKDFKPELFVLSGFSQILHDEILSLPSLGAINLHGGKLPEYRGASVINWQIINGETEGGCSIIRVNNSKIDFGDILIQETYRITYYDTAETIYKKTLPIFSDMLLYKMKELSTGGTLIYGGKKQSTHEGKYYCKRYPRDSQIFWENMTSKNVYDLVRAMNGPDLPPAYSFLKIKDETYKIEIIEVEEMGETIVGPYGRVALKRKNGVVVICKDKGILIKKIKLGDEIISATYFLNSGGYTFHKRDE